MQVSNARQSSDLLFMYFILSAIYSLCVHRAFHIHRRQIFQSAKVLFIFQNDHRRIAM